MTDKTLGAYERTTPDPDETTGQALARLQAEMTRLLDAVDAELSDEADGGVAAALIEKEADTRTREHILHEESRLLNLERSLRSHLSRTINRAEKAERERDEALYQRDQWMRGSDSWRATLDEAIEERRRIARALDLPENATADAMATRIEEVESRLLTPDAITDEARARARAELRQFIAEGGPVESSEGARARAVDIVLTAALTEPPARPEGAEELGELIGEYLDSTPGEDDTGMADFLAENGVRVVTEEQP